MAGSDLSFNITALDSASKTFIALATRVETFTDKLDKLDRQRVEPTVDVDTDRAGRKVDTFSTELRTKISAAVKALPKLELDADSTLADAKLQQLRDELVSLGNKTIGVDIDANDARAQLSELQNQLTRLSGNSANAQIRVDTAQASGELAKFEAMLRKVDGETAHAKIDVDTGSLASASNKMEQFGSSSGRLASGRIVAALSAGLLVGAPLLAAAGVTVIGGATAAMVLEVEKSDPRVAAAVAQIGDTTKATLGQAFGSTVPVITGAVGQWEQAIRGGEPVFAELARSSVPFITQLNSSLIQSGQTVLPAFASAMSQSAPVTHALSAGISDVDTGVVELLQHMDFDQAGAGLQSLMQDAGQLIPVVGNLLNSVEPLGNAVLSSVVPAVITLADDMRSDLAPILQVVGSILNALAPEFEAMAGPIAVLGTAALVAVTVRAAMQGVNTAIAAGKAGFASLESGVNAVTGQFGLLSVSGQKAAFAQADLATATARETVVSAESKLAALEEAAATDTSAVAAKRVAIAKDELTVANEAATASEAELAAVAETSTFAFGPVGIVLGAVALALGALVGGASSASSATQQAAFSLQDLETAAAGGTSALAKFYAQHPVAAQDIATLKGLGVTMNDLSEASNGNVGASQKVSNAWNGMVGRQQALVDSTKKQIAALESSNNPNSNYGAQTTDNSVKIADLTGKLKTGTDTLNGYKEQQKQATEQVNANKAAQQAAAAGTDLSAQSQSVASSVARQFGGSIGAVNSSLTEFIQQSKDSGTSVVDLTQQWAESQTALAASTTTAASAISDHFAQADQAVTQAQQSLSSANYSYKQSIQAVTDSQYQVVQAQQSVADSDHQLQQAELGVTDALHNRDQAGQQVIQAQQGIRDADQGVIAAERNLVQAQQSERDAQVALTTARKQAEEQLIALNLQLKDQYASEEQAKLGLFDAQQSAAALGITLANAQGMLGQPISVTNEAQIKAALDLVQAQNQLNDTLNSGKDLRDQVSQANAAGVNGAQGVISAERALVSAQQQEASSAQAILKAQQQVTAAHQQLTSANYSLQKANQAVTDADYNVGKAHQAVAAASHGLQGAEEGVTNAQHNQAQAAQQVTAAQRELATAQDGASRSLDVNTKAGAANFTLLDSLNQSLIKQGIPTQDRYSKIVNTTADAFGVSHDKAVSLDKGLNLLGSDYIDGAKAARNYAAAIAAVVTQMNRQAAANQQRYEFQATHPLSNGGSYFGGPTAATGAIIPGYAPGVDSVHALVSPGEGILVPELVRQIGPGNIMAANAAASKHRYSHGGIVGFAGGGVVSPAPAAQANVVAPPGADLSVMTGSATNLNAVLTALSATIAGPFTAAMAQMEQDTGVLAPAAITLLMSRLGFLGLAETQLSATTNVAWTLITQRILNSDNAIWARQASLQSQMSVSWSVINSAVQASVFGQEAAFSGLNAGMAGVRAAASETNAWVSGQFSAMQGGAANPARWVIQNPINAGLIAAWNSINSQFALGRPVKPVGIGFASGGLIRGPGTGTSDSIQAPWVSNGEYVVRESITAQALPFLNALNAGQPEALQATGGPHAKSPNYASGGLVADTGSQVNAAVGRGTAAMAQMKGKRYIWGGASPEGADCSGLVAIITNALRGESDIFHRIGSAGSQPWPGFVGGLHSAFGTGFNSHHTAGTLAGVNFEARDFGIPIMVGGGAVGATDGQFTGTASLPVVGGQFVPGSGGGFDPSSMVTAAFAKTLSMIADGRKMFAGNISGMDGLDEASRGADSIKKFSIDKLSSLAGTAGSVPPASGNAAAAQAFARAALARFGWGQDQWSPLLSLWQKESSWDANAVNKSSGAYGIPQSLGHGHPYNLGDYANQIIWGDNYIKDRYGNPAAAWAHEMSHNWYRDGGLVERANTAVFDGGGMLGPGMTGVNLGRKPEGVLTPEETAGYKALAAAAANGSLSKPSVTVNVYAQEGMSVSQIAAEVDRRIEFALR